MHQLALHITACSTQRRRNDHRDCPKDEQWNERERCKGKPTPQEQDYYATTVDQASMQQGLNRGGRV